MPTQNKTSTTNAAQKLIAGVKKHFLKVPTLVFGGVAYTPTQVVDALQAVVDATVALSQAKAAWVDAIAKLRTAVTAAKPIADGVRQTARLQFGDQVALDDFGIAPHKKAKPKAATKAAAALKAKATRALTHVLGPKQRKHIATAAKDGTVLVTAPTTK
jgi:hypothetical protein